MLDENEYKQLKEEKEKRYSRVIFLEDAIEELDRRFAAIKPMTLEELLKHPSSVVAIEEVKYKLLAAPRSLSRLMKFLFRVPEQLELLRRDLFAIIPDEFGWTKKTDKTLLELLQEMVDLWGESLPSIREQLQEARRQLEEASDLCWLHSDSQCLFCHSKIYKRNGIDLEEEAFIIKLKELIQTKKRSVLSSSQKISGSDANGS